MRSEDAHPRKASVGEMRPMAALLAWGTTADCTGGCRDGRLRATQEHCDQRAEQGSEQQRHPAAVAKETVQARGMTADERTLEGFLNDEDRDQRECCRQPARPEAKWRRRAYLSVS